MNENSNTLGIYTETIPRMVCPHCEAELDVSDFGVFEDIVCPSCKDPIRVPGRLGDFILIDELGRGAMGCVYLAQDESLNRLVALKVIRREYGTDPKMLETVQREAQAMATLNHRNIVQVYSFGRVDQQPYFVMELLTGERLDESLEDGGVISEIRALEIALDVSQGLEAANKAGLTHGDIKPANILMNEQGVAKVVDFGLAHFMEPGAEIEVWGTPYYIAPEKARKKGEDSRSDQYSLGATIFHALAGHTPFDGENPTKVVLAALKQDTPLLRDHNPEVTEKTEAVIRRMMDKNPNRRYPTYASLKADLQEALDQARAAEEARRLEEQRQHERAHKKKNPLVGIMMATTLTIALGVGGAYWYTQRRASSTVEITYSGPKRKPHEPIQRVEERNLREAAAAVKAGDLSRAEDKLAIAARHMPDTHAAKGWHKFFAAGVYLYAQYPQQARGLLESLADSEEMLFDQGETPPEDPRVLARYALGRLHEEELEKNTRRAQIYYRHLAEVARGYREYLESRPMQASRHFRTYGEYGIQGLRWPYVLQPIASSLHLPRDPLKREEEKQEKAEERGMELLAGLGVRTVEGHPVFRLAEVSSSGQILLNKTSSPEWKPYFDGDLARAGDYKRVLSGAKGVQVLPGRRFTVFGIFRMPTEKDREIGDADMIVYLGGPMGEAAEGETPPARGVALELAPALKSNPDRMALRLRIGDGEKDVFVQTVDSDLLLPGGSHLISLTWDGLGEEGEEAPNRLALGVNDKEVASWTLEKNQMPSGGRLDTVVYGAPLLPDGTVGRAESDIKVVLGYVLDHLPDFEDVYTYFNKKKDLLSN